MLEALFESLDDKVFTPELKESLETKFNEAVEDKAAIVAAEQLEEQVDSLNEKAEQHIEMLNEKAEEYVEMKKTEMVDSLDKYLDRVVEEFVSESKTALGESVKSEKADMLIEAFDAMLVATGVKVATIVEAKDDTAVESQLEESVAKYDTLVEENINLLEANKQLTKMGIIAELKENLSLVESEKFEKLADIVDFSNDADYLKKLETIKESVKGAAVEDKAEDAGLNEDQVNVPVWAHLV